jgi:hypothetical protein
MIMMLGCLLHLLQPQLRGVTITTTITKKIEVQTNQHHPLLPPLDQRRYLHHLVLRGEMIIKITTVVVEEGGEEIVGTGIIVVKKTTDDTMIVTIGEDEEVMIDMMIEIGMWIEEEIITVMIIVIRMTG